ncbi:MAG: hypothetical protein ABL923_12335 [Burkholderiaceae bacterium]
MNKFKRIVVLTISIFSASLIFAKEPDCKQIPIYDGQGVTRITYGAYSYNIFGQCSNASPESISLIIDNNNINDATLIMIKGMDYKDVLNLNKNFPNEKIPIWAFDVLESQMNIINRDLPLLSGEIKRQLDNRGEIIAKAASDLAAAAKSFRDSLAKMNAGQLFAKADELSSQGDKAKAREVLRILVSRFPDHPLAATAAQQIAALGNTANNGSTTESAGGRSAGGNQNLQMSCNDSIEKYLRTLPNFSSSTLKTVVSGVRTDAGLLMQAAKAGKITQAYPGEYQKMAAEYKDRQGQVLDAWDKSRPSGVSKVEAGFCNPTEDKSFSGSLASAWAATQIGHAFAVWGLNYSRCTLGQTPSTSIPAFCPF